MCTYYSRRHEPDVMIRYRGVSIVRVDPAIQLRRSASKVDWFKSLKPIW